VELKRDSHLGRYNIRSNIGEGGMGVVYRAYDEQLRRQVAIKTIQGDKASDQEFLTRFKREALAISQIDHPHIVRIFDFVDAANGQLSYMVMELLSGKDLGRVIGEQGPLAFSRAVDRILEVCAAVGECHRRGYVHRDLKPTNIFLAEYNQIETAKVLDFGAAKQEEHRERPADDSAELTRKGTFLGTPYYMPPEQIMGKPATAKSDQYSLAVVLYTAVTGQKPFEIDRNKEFKDWELLQAIKQGEYTPVQELRPDVPGGLADAIHKAMNVDPAKRFVDLHAFGAELRAFASPQAKLTWEAFFTSSPPTRRAPPLSIAVMAHGGRPKIAAALDGPTNVDPVDPTFPPPDSLHGTGPTVAVKGERQQTLPISTAELKAVSGELSYATTRKRSSDLPSASISIAIEEDSQSGEALQTDPPSKKTTSEATGKSLFRNRPALIVLGAAALFAGVVVAAFVITHEKALPPAVPQPPAAQPVAAPPPVPRAVTPAPAVPQPSPPAAGATAQTTAAAPPSELNAAPTAAKHHAHKKPKHPLLDTHGIPIPTD
jgi:eukaryotic-like serine/threonine-protein kinase